MQISGAHEPLIDVRMMCRSIMEVTCSISSGSYGIWTFYRTRDGLEDMQNMGKVVYSEQKCQLTSLKTTELTQCICIDGNRVICNISDDSIAKTGDTWQCGRFINGASSLSTPIIVLSKETSECTTTTGLRNVAEGGKTFTNTITSLNIDTVTVTEVVKMFTEARAINVTTEEVSISTTTNANETKRTDSGESVSEHFNTFSNKEFIIIMTAAGVTVFVAMNVSFCVYWKFKTRSVAINLNDTEKENITPQQTTMMLMSSLQMIEDDNTHVNYHEISEIQIPSSADVWTLSNMMSRVGINKEQPLTVVDSDNSNPLRSAMEQPTSRTGATLRTTQEPISFLALAEINMSDIAEMELETHRTDVKSVRYESLDPTRRDDKSQYRTLDEK